MQTKQKAERSAFKRVRTVKDITLGVEALVILALVGFLTSSTYTVDPLYVPLEGALFVLLMGALAVSVELIVFRALEIKHAPTDGQRYLVVAAGLRSAKRAAGVGLVVALFFALPVTQAILVNVISHSETRILEVGESDTFAFSSEDSLGLTRATSLRVTVLTGALRISLSVENQPPTYGADIAAGEQFTSAITSPQVVPYVLTFENLDNDRTRFSFRVDMDVSPPLVSLLTITSLVVAGTNLGWLIYLRRRREDLPQPPPRQRAPTMTMSTPARRPIKPMYRARGFWTPGQYPWGAQAPPPGWGTPSPVPKARRVARPPPPPPPEEAREEAEKPAEEEKLEESEPSLKEFDLDIPAALEEASAKVETGELPDALEVLETVLQIDGRNREALLRKADLLQRMGEAEEALRLLEEMLHLDPWSEEALLFKGQLLGEAGREEEALGCYEAVLHGGPRHLEALVRKGDLLAGKGEHDLAKDAYERALKLKPGDPDLKARMQSLQELREDALDTARREAKAGDVKRAEELYKRALSGNRESEARQELIELLFNEGREEDCIRLLDKAMMEAPEDYPLVIKRAQALFKSGRLEEALKDSERVVEGNPEMASAWSIKGIVESDMGLRERARESLERALSLDPEDGEAGRRLREMDREERERAQLEEELRSIPEVPEGAIPTIMQNFSSLQKMKKASVKKLSSLEGVSEEVAKVILKQVRRGR